VAEVLSIMAGVTVEFQCTTPVEAAQVTAVVGIAGAIRANLIIRCTQETSMTLVSQMLGLSPDTAHSHKTANDALGQICNVVAGYFKAKIGLGEAMWAFGPDDYRRKRLQVSFGGKLRAVRISRFVSGRDACI